MRTIAIAATFVCASLALAAPAGTVYVLPQPIDVKAPDFEGTAKKDSVKELEKHEGKWSLFVVAYLKHSPGANQVDISFFDKEKKRPDPAASITVGVQPSAKVLASSISVADDAGVEAGKTYEVKITKVGKPDVLASTMLTFK
jgi:hypothetical protein